MYLMVKLSALLQRDSTVPIVERDSEIQDGETPFYSIKYFAGTKIAKNIPFLIFLKKKRRRRKK